MCRMVAVALFIVTWITVGWSESKHAPLPQKVINAKTVYIDNRSGYANIADKAYDELQKWGRFRIIGDVKDADLVLLFSASSYHGGYTSTATVFSNTNEYSGNTQTTGTVTSNTAPQIISETHLTLIDPKTGESIWSDSREWGRFRSATRGLLKDLRKRMTEQEKGK